MNQYVLFYLGLLEKKINTLKYDAAANDAKTKFIRS